MHHLTWHEGGAAVLIPPRELDGARPCSVQLSGWMRAWWRWWSWVWFISTFAVNKIYAHDAPFELTSNLGCNAHLSWVRCISSLLPFAGGLWWWCNWLVAAEWVTVASMSQSTFKHTSAAAIFFLLHEGSSEFYAKPFPEPASQLADSEALWRDWLFCMKVHASSMPIPSQS